MGSNFNPLVLVDKLTKLNSSQQSIEILSHWCIFHMNEAKQVVETWNRQFHCSPREQRLPFLYLANDILQNSRRKGIFFVTEFWKVLPDSLRDVIENGDEFDRNAVFRLINIWEERKVFGSRGQILKEEFVKRKVDNDSRSWKHSGIEQLSSSGNTLHNLLSGYQAVIEFQQEEDTMFYKCRNAIIFVKETDKGIEGHAKGSVTDELKGQTAILRDCIPHLTAIESSRSNLVSVLREALQEQEDKLDQLRNQLQAAQVHSELAERLCRQLLCGNDVCKVQTEQSGIEIPAAQVWQNLKTGLTEQLNSAIHGRKLSFAEKTGRNEENPQTAADAMAAQLTTSTTAAQVLSHAFSSLSSGAITNPIKKSSSDYISEKRARIMNDHPYVPQYPQASIPAFSHLEHLNNTLPDTLQELNTGEPSPPPPPPPPPSSSPPPLLSLPPPSIQLSQIPQYMHTTMPVHNGPYDYSMSQQFPEPLPSYSPVESPVNGVSPLSPPSNAYQNYPTEGVFCGQSPSSSMAPSDCQSKE